MTTTSGNGVPAPMRGRVILVSSPASAYNLTMSWTCILLCDVVGNAAQASECLVHREIV